MVSTRSVATIVGILAGVWLSYARGRLIVVNGKPVREIVPAEESDYNELLECLKRFYLARRKGKKNNLFSQKLNKSTTTALVTNNATKFRRQINQEEWLYFSENPTTKLKESEEDVYETVRSWIHSLSGDKPLLFKTDFALEQTIEN